MLTAKRNRFKLISEIGLSLCALLFPITSAFSADIDQIRAAIEANGAKWTAEENPISRLSPEEFKKRLGAKLSLESKTPVNESFYVPLALPSSFDWRNVNGSSYVTGVRNQNQCGDCWAFATTAALESMTLITFNWPNYDLNLSEQIVLSCSGAGDCSSGYADKASTFLEQSGTSFENCYPYTGTDGNCGSACSNWQNSTFKFQNWSFVVKDSIDITSVSAIKNALYSSGPVAAWMKVYEDFRLYKGGVYSYVSGNYVDSHFVLIIGWDDLQSAFIVKNSWGTDWGESGFFWIAYSEVTGNTQFGYETLAYGHVIAWFPDLVVTSLTGPSSGVIGGTINVSATVKNQGPTDAGPFRLGFYFSQDSIIETGDTLFGSCNYTTGLKAGASNTCSGPLTVPPISAGTYYLGAIADDLGQVTRAFSDNTRVADTGPIQLTPQTMLYTLTTNPQGLQITVDGSIYTAPHTFNWTVGSSHTLSINSPQNGGTSGTRYIYSSWSDGGAQTHTITALSSSTTYTATFSTQYQLTITSFPPVGGAVTPSPMGDQSGIACPTLVGVVCAGYYSSGTLVTLTATPNSGYTFNHWSGDASGTNNPVTLTIDSNKTVTGNFTSTSVTPASYPFGNVKVKKSKTASFVVKNNGTANLSILSSTITGTNASMFKITSGGGSKTIKPGKTLTIKVAFKPTSTGSKSANLEINSNDPVTPTLDIPLTGTGQ